MWHEVAAGSDNDAFIIEVRIEKPVHAGLGLRFPVPDKFFLQ